MGDVPHWQGATVSQVCLAEGSAEFIGLGEVARAAGGNIATLIAEEQINCAWVRQQLCECDSLLE